MKNKTVIIAGASRGIGAAMAKCLAASGWNVVILAKCALVPHGKLDGERTVAQEIADLGGSVLALPVDVRFEDQVKNAVAEAVDVFGGIDALINVASALPFDGSPKQLQLVHDIIVNGTRFCTEACLPYLQKSGTAHVINIAPPLPMAEHWIEKYGAYAEAKRAVSEYTKEMAKDHKNILFHTLWPVKMIYTAATIFGVFKSEEKARMHTRNPEIMADAAKFLIEGNAPSYNWCLNTDEEVLKFYAGMTDFSRYLMPGSKEEDLMPDVFV